MHIGVEARVHGRVQGGSREGPIDSKTIARMWRTGMRHPYRGVSQGEGPMDSEIIACHITWDPGLRESKGCVKTKAGILPRIGNGDGSRTPFSIPCPEISKYFFSHASFRGSNFIGMYNF